MASSSENETSSGSSTVQNSGSEEDAQVLMDQRKRKRMISKHGSAIRKQKHLENLVATVARLKNENQQILNTINLANEGYIEAEAGNSFLRAQMFELRSKLSSFRFYDVFLSFRGEDTRASFVSHLYASLQNSGIIVFKDDESLPRGDHISLSLLRAIEQSRISVVVFSRNYAESQWCLNELAQIMESHRTIGQVVFPVFCGVDPSEVRHQTGEFGKAFHSLLDRILAQEREELRWMETLREVASISRIVVLNSRNENEAIKSIVENITRLLDKTEMFIADNPVGVEPRVQDTIQLLDLKRSNNVLLLGMWGMGGIGKTTIAKAIYNKIGRNFEGRSFLAHIREVWGKKMAKSACKNNFCLISTRKQKQRYTTLNLEKTY